MLSSPKEHEGKTVRALLTGVTSSTLAVTARAALVALAALATVNVALAQAIPPVPDPKPLTPAQDDSIREEMQGLAQVLVNGGKTPDEATLATSSVGICLGAAYGYGLTRAQAEAVCGEVLDAFTVQPGTTVYTLTPDDKTWVAGKVQGWTGELSAVLDPSLLGAAQTTMSACIEGHLKRAEERADSVRHCLLGILPLLNRPEFRQRLIDAANKLP
jgi:hypothetical protein